MFQLATATILVLMVTNELTSAIIVTDSPILYENPTIEYDVHGNPYVSTIFAPNTIARRHSARDIFGFDSYDLHGLYHP